MGVLSCHRAGWDDRLLLVRRCKGTLLREHVLLAHTIQAFAKGYVLHRAPTSLRITVIVCSNEKRNIAVGHDSSPHNNPSCVEDKMMRSAEGAHMTAA